MDLAKPMVSIDKTGDGTFYLEI